MSNPEQNAAPVEQKVRRKRSREEKKKLLIRIMALIMAVLMVAGAAYYTLYLLATAVSAADVNSTMVTETVQIPDTSSLTNGGDVPVRVGLMTGDSVTTGFEVTATNGFTIGMTDDKNAPYPFTPLWDLSVTKLSAVSDGNLSKSFMTYSITWDTDTAVVGGYHVQVDCDQYDREQVEEMISKADSSLAGTGLAVIPAYVYTGYTLRIGSFTTKAQAQEWVETVQSLFPGETVYATGASETSVSIVDPDTDRILFEFDCGGKVELGMRAKEDANGNTYMKTPAANVYDGIFVFSRYRTDKIDGVALTNILSLEAYIAGVLPYEVSNGWPLETLKAFAITVRSFTLTHLGRHEADGYDLCRNVHCQVYKGAGRVNGNVMEAVTGTMGQVMTYQGEMVTSYYSSSMGGTTVSAKDAWGGDVPYLQAKATPWENYMVHENAFWMVEMTPTELADRLRQAGYNVRGTVSRVEIGELAQNSTYIKRLDVTDSTGQVIRITGTDAVRTALTPHIRSSNFVVGKGSVEYTETVVNYAKNETAAETNGTVTETGTVTDTANDSSGVVSTNPEEYPFAYMKKDNQDQDDTEAQTNTREKGTVYTGSVPYSVYFPSDDTAQNQYDKDYGYTDLLDYQVLTAEGTYISQIENSVVLMTAEGGEVYQRQDIFVITSEGAEAFDQGDISQTPPQQETVQPQEPDHVTETLDKSTETTLYKVAYADNPQNFIFVGKGWGHGVGMSQYGAYDLAMLGYDYIQILEAYFDNIKLVHYRSVKTAS